MAFSVASVPHTVKWLATRQISCEPIHTDEHTGKRFTFFSNPDNLPLELYEQ
nr:hypothetical protein [Shewanella fodinae]